MSSFDRILIRGIVTVKARPGNEEATFAKSTLRIISSGVRVELDTRNCHSRFQLYSDLKVFARLHPIATLILFHVLIPNDTAQIEERLFSL